MVKPRMPLPNALMELPKMLFCISYLEYSSVLLASGLFCPGLLSKWSPPINALPVLLRVGKGNNKHHNDKFGSMIIEFIVITWQIL